jgi:hypothetical protein
LLEPHSTLSFRSRFGKLSENPLGPTPILFHRRAGRVESAKLVQVGEKAWIDSPDLRRVLVKRVIDDRHFLAPFSSLKIPTVAITVVTMVEENQVIRKGGPVVQCLIVVKHAVQGQDIKRAVVVLAQAGEPSNVRRTPVASWTNSPGISRFNSRSIFVRLWSVGLAAGFGALHGARVSTELDQDLKRQHERLCGLANFFSACPEKITA